jgi:formylglycine-generating enzyme
MWYSVKPLTMKASMIGALLIVFTVQAMSQDKPEIQWIGIPSGTFTMGSPETEFGRESGETQHSVTISAFRISKFEITFDQYDTFCEATGRKKPDDAGWGRGDHPVINVTWTDAKAFADWMNCRLPTEAEWEYACRAGTTTPFNTGENITTAEANYDGTEPYKRFPAGEFRGKTMSVGNFPPNSWGLYDMHGNVWEWCSDWLDSYTKDPQTNPSGPAFGYLHIGRGGSWKNIAQRCRSAYRYGRSPTYKSNALGFRLVTDN